VLHADIFEMHFMTSRPQKERKAQPGAEAASTAACAIGFSMGLSAQNRMYKNF
jgi:protein tyrosine phosphatase (PTP) superfamily phosphohydrolase (DUF442 family)